MDVLSVTHLQYLQSEYKELNTTLGWNKLIQVREVPRNILNPFSRGKLRQLCFDVELKANFLCHRTPCYLSILIDENLRYDAYDVHGDTYQEKLSLLHINENTLPMWAYFHISGNEVSLVEYSNHNSFPIKSTLDLTLEELHLWYQSNCLIN